MTGSKSKTLGNHFSGMEITRDDGGLILTQMKYAFDLLDETCFTLSKLAATPIETNIKLS